MASPLPRATPGRSKYISNPRMRTVLVPLQNRPPLMMMVRGGGFPTSLLAFIPIGRMGPPLRRFAADAHDCIMFGSLDLPHTRLRCDSTAPESAVPSDCHPRRTTARSRHDEARRDRTKTDDGENASPCLTRKAPSKGLSADSEEKRVLASDMTLFRV